MKSMFQFIAAVACVATLTACGGGAKTTTVVVPQPAFKVTDTVLGTGTVAAVGDPVVIHYTGYLYDSTKADFKGAKVESSVDTGKPASPFTLGVGAVLAGWDQAIVGMKVGGKRNAILPANLAYGGATRSVPNPNPYGYAAITANAPMVYDLELLDVVKTVPQVPVAPPTVLQKVDNSIGSGTVAATGKSVTVRYTGWLYDGTRADLKGLQFDSSIGKSDLPVVLGSGNVIKGFNDGIIGMAVGGVRTITIPPDQAYGEKGSGVIPANATLIFQIQLMSSN